MRERITTVSAALVFGSLWGLAEATAGHALHGLRVPGLAGFLMFPLGFFLMSRAYARNGRPAAVLMTSWVAASVKLVDLLLPGVDVMAVLNPAQAILLQGLAAAGGLHFCFGAGKIKVPGAPFDGSAVFFPNGGTRRAQKPGVPAVEPAALLLAGAASALAWRAAHLALSLLWTALFQAPNILQAGSALFLRFLVLDSLVNGALIFVLMKASSSLKKDRAHPGVFRLLFRPAASLACLAAAIVAEVVL